MMNRSPQKLVVTIKGTRGAGKSAVAQAINQILEAYGLRTEVRDDLDASISSNWPKRLGALAQGGTPVLIATEARTRAKVPRRAKK
jgi:predicted kinase